MVLAMSEQQRQLEQRARQLSKEMGYVSEMGRLCSALVYATGQLLKLMDENKQRDERFGQQIAEVNGAAHAKVQLADKWIIENTAKLDRMSNELANWGESHD
jgi:hypothetical protein